MTDGLRSCAWLVRRSHEGLKGKTSVYGVVLVRNRYGNLCLDMELTTESEVAATTGSAATM